MSGGAVIADSEFAHCQFDAVAVVLSWCAFLSNSVIMQVSPRGSDSSTESPTTGQQSSGAATGEASAAAGHSVAPRGAFDMPFMRRTPRKHPGGWMGRTATVAGGELNATLKIAHQDVFMGESVCKDVI